MNLRDLRERIDPDGGDEAPPPIAPKGWDDLGIPIEAFPPFHPELMPDLYPWQEHGPGQQPDDDLYPGGEGWPDGTLYYPGYGWVIPPENPGDPYVVIPEGGNGMPNWDGLRNVRGTDPLPPRFIDDGIITANESGRIIYNIPGWGQFIITPSGVLQFLGLDGQVWVWDPKGGQWLPPYDLPQGHPARPTRPTYGPPA